MVLCLIYPIAIFYLVQDGPRLIFLHVEELNPPNGQRCGSQGAAKVSEAISSLSLAAYSLQNWFQDYVQALIPTPGYTALLIGMKLQDQGSKSKVLEDVL